MTLENRDVVCNGSNDRTKGLYRVKRNSSSERERFGSKLLRKCEIARERKGKESKRKTRKEILQEKNFQCLLVPPVHTRTAVYKRRHFQQGQHAPMMSDAL